MIYHVVFTRPIIRDVLDDIKKKKKSREVKRFSKHMHGGGVHRGHTGVLRRRVFVEHRAYAI